MALFVQTNVLASVDQIRCSSDKLSRRRAWRHELDIAQLRHDVVSVTQAVVEDNWDRCLFPEDLPDLEYPFVEGLALGHSMQFSGPLSLTMYGRHTLSRILLVLTYKNPDLVYCPLLVHFIVLMLTFLDPSRTFAVANAMVCSSRNSPPSGLTKYFPLQRSDLDIMASSLSGLVPSGIQSLTEFFTGEFLAVMSLPVQLRIFSCFVHEGAKIIYRVAIAIIRRCRQDLLSSDSELATTDAFRRLCISQYCESKAFMKTIFAIHLSRSRIERFIRQAKDSRSRALVMAPSTNHVPLWPNIDQARKWSNIIDVQTWLFLWAQVLSARFRFGSPRIAFSTQANGHSLGLLRQQAMLQGACLLVIRDSRRVVFGVFLSRGITDGWQVDLEAVAFTNLGGFRSWGIPATASVDDDRCVFVCHLSDRSLSVSVGSKPVLLLQEDLQEGRAESVLGNDPLTQTAADGVFIVHEVEVIVNF
ncbi:hypothetical protein PBRA_005789 [Plasmodiophora brassicae]|uniref:Uncharacterized protein n=1 Tax=Plasmodiophora brassicae TaxID=37360 RepID=A0A0G4IR07_PLABS|nr:hypothetical protein PBRA_005789 [Plasmodiophora brassicae]